MCGAAPSARRASPGHIAPGAPRSTAPMPAANVHIAGGAPIAHSSPRPPRPNVPRPLTARTLSVRPLISWRHSPIPTDAASPSAARSPERRAIDPARSATPASTPSTTTGARHRPPVQPASVCSASRCDPSPTSWTRSTYCTLARSRPEHPGPNIPVFRQPRTAIRRSAVSVPRGTAPSPPGGETSRDPRTHAVRAPSR